MPKIILPLPETYASITRPLMLAIARKVIKDTRMDANIPILFPDHAEAVQQKNSSIDSPTGVSSFGNTEQIKIDYKEEFNEEYFLAGVTSQHEHPFIFKDVTLPIGLRPIYGKQNVSVNMAIRFRDKNSANKWRDSMAMHLHGTGPMEVFSTAYHYLVPFEALYILGIIHGLREKVAGYGQDFDTYFKKHSTERLTKVTTLAGDVENYAIAESQCRIVGAYDFQTYPEEGTKDNDSETWTINITYKFSYDKPIGTYFNYPLMVHNQLIPKKIRAIVGEQVPFNPDLVKSYYSLSGEYLRNFETAMDYRPYMIDEGYAFPTWDEFIPGAVHGHTKRIMTVMCKITEDDKSSLCNIFDIDGMHYSDEVKELVASEIPWITEYKQSLFNVSLYAHNKMVSGITVLPNGDVVATSPLDMRIPYHVRLSVIDDLQILPPDVIDRVREKGKALIQIIEYIKPNYKTPIILIGDWVPKKTIEDIIDKTNKHNPDIDSVHNFKTVGIVSLESHVALRN